MYDNFIAACFLDGLQCLCDPSNTSRRNFIWKRFELTLLQSLLDITPDFGCTLLMHKGIRINILALDILVFAKHVCVYRHRRYNQTSLGTERTRSKDISIFHTNCVPCVCKRWCNGMDLRDLFVDGKTAIDKMCSAE